MAGNTRGKLKEKFEGVHRNFEWCKLHLGESLVLVGQHNPNLKGSIESLLEAIETMDELAMNIYAQI